MGEKGRIREYIDYNEGNNGRMRGWGGMTGRRVRTWAKDGKKEGSWMGGRTKPVWCEPERRVKRDIVLAESRNSLAPA